VHRDGDAADALAAKIKKILSEPFSIEGNEPVRSSLRLVENSAA
jgi:hypothetical protein